MEIRGQRKKIKSSVQGAVCVIDGDQGIRHSLYMLLGTLGVRVIAFSTAEDFLDCLNSERPAFLITELALPGMSGFELKEALDDQGIQIPVMGLTADVDPGNGREASRLGFLDLVEKPFVYWSIVEQVQQAMGLPR
jgi:FixJ family two-component response regulator